MRRGQGYEETQVRTSWDRTGDKSSGGMSGGRCFLPRAWSRSKSLAGMEPKGVKGLSNE